MQPQLCKYVKMHLNGIFQLFLEYFQVTSGQGHKPYKLAISNSCGMKLNWSLAKIMRTLFCELTHFFLHVLFVAFGVVRVLIYKVAMSNSCQHDIYNRMRSNWSLAKIMHIFLLFYFLGLHTLSCICCLWFWSCMLCDTFIYKFP